MLAFLRSRSDNLIFVLLFPACPKLLSVIGVSLCFPFSPVFIPSLGHYFLMLTGFSVTFLLTTPKSIFLSVPTDPVLALPLLGLIGLMAFQVGMDGIKLSQVEL